MGVNKRVCYSLLMSCVSLIYGAQVPEPKTGKGKTCIFPPKYPKVEF